MIKSAFVLVCLVAQCYASYESYGYANIGKVIPAAVKSQWRLEVKPVHLPQEPIQPQVIEIPPIDLPVKILYNSKSSGVFVQQVHQPGGPGQSEATKSEEEPHRLSHEVVRPVIQELREIIIPYRRVVQEIAPVVEDIQTVVAQGQGRQTQGLAGGVLPSITAGGTGLGGGLSGVSIDSLLSGGGGGYGSVESGKGLIGLSGSGLGGYGAKGLSGGHSGAASAAGGAAAAKKA